MMEDPRVAAARALRWPPGAEFGLGLALVAAYALVQTFGLPAPVLTVWLVLAIGLTLLSPLAGLTILSALGPFTEALTSDGHPTAVPFLLAALGVSVAVHFVVTRPRPRPSAPVVLALVVFGGTALGVITSTILYGADRGLQAAQLWVPGIGGGLTVLLGAAWLSSRGEVRPLFAAVASISLGALLSVVNTATGGGVQHSALGWMLRADVVEGGRLAGLLPAPNAAAAIFVVGLAACLALALGHPQRKVQQVALACAAILLVALVLTFSRSGLLAAALVIALLCWRRWRWQGLIVAGGGLMVVAVLAAVWVGLSRDLTIQSDQDRLAAWAASVRIWLANPLLGAGFRSFEWLHGEYGSQLLNAPHNEWLRFFAEEGTIVGLAGLAFALLTPLVLLRTPGYVAAGAGAAAAGLFVLACFNNPFLYAQVNVPAFIVIGAGLGLARRAPPGPVPS